MKDEFTISLAVHEKKLGYLRSQPEPKSDWDASMRRGSMQYHEEAIRAIRKLRGEIRQAAGR